MHITRFSRNFLFLLFVFYYAQGSLYPSGSIISQTCLFLILLISVAYFVKTLLLENGNNLFFNAWSLLLLLNIIGFIFVWDSSNIFYFGMFKNILGCMLPFYPFYYFAKNDELKASHLVIFFMVMLPIIILQFYTNQSKVLSERISQNTDVVNNIAYSFVRLLPFVFLIKKGYLFLEH